MQATRTVGVVVDLAGAHGRSVLAGVSEYAVARRWRLRTPRPWLFAGMPTDWDRWEVDGLIVSGFAPEIVERAVNARRPVVTLSSPAQARGRLPMVGLDHAAVGRIAAEDLLGRGFRRLAYAGCANAYWSGTRGSTFASAVREGGATCVECDISEGAAGCGAKGDDLGEWLARVRKPAAVFAGNDQLALQVLDLCLRLDLAVPEQVAVLGVDDDELVRRLASPSLSSVRPGGRRIGLGAADLLARMMDGEAVPIEPRLLPPLGVATRQSTDVVAIEDPGVAVAMHFIRAHAHEPIGVGEVAEAAAVGRRTLERRFRDVLGRSPLEEIRRQRIERGRELLTETDLTIEEIARSCGFRTASRFWTVFREQTGRTPGEHRERR